MTKKPERTFTGQADQSGTPIHTGDIIEFYFSPDCEPNNPFWKKKGYKNKDYTRMRDLVEEIDGKFYATCFAGGAFLHRYAAHSKIIGTDPKLIDT